MIRSPVVIIVSMQDEAGMNISSFIQEEVELTSPTLMEIPKSWPDGDYFVQYNSTKSLALVTMSAFHFQADFIGDFFDTNLIIFASKHLSKAQQKALLVHPLGNWGKATHQSGRDYKLASTAAHALTKGYLALKYHKEKIGLTNYWVGVEATHHGPTELSAPAIFIEVGGTKNEWSDLLACKVVAKSLLDITNDYIKLNFSEAVPAIIGIGGGHYAPSFLKRVEVGMFQFGHIMPKYFMHDVSENLLKQAWENTHAKTKLFLIDKKGSRGRDRKRIIELLDKLQYPYAMTTDYSIQSKN